MYVPVDTISIIDLLIFALLGWGLYKGFVHGAIVQALAFAALIVGIFFAIRFTSWVSELVKDEAVDSMRAFRIAVFFILFLGVVIGVEFLTKIVTGLVSEVRAGMVMQLLGAFFSFIKYLMILSVFFSIFNQLDSSYNLLSRKQKYGSRFYSRISKFAPAIYPYLGFKKSDKDIVNDKWKDYYDKLKKERKEL